MSPAPDQAAREHALDVERSVIVQAPAGSGKTTLLVQRYLRLLGRASRPEEILAITFTRKAAAEMRERVLQALRDGAPEAAAALRRDREAGWELTEQPTRLKIQTIDSFASALVRQLPLTAAFRPGAELVEDASDAYRQAVDRLFQRLYQDDPLGPELAAVLALFDNDYATTRRLLAAMLARRDQWLDLVRGVVQLGHRDPGSVRRLIGSALTELARRVVAELDACLDDGDRHILHDAIRYAADRLGERLDAADDVYRLAGRLLITSQGTLRRRLTRQHGFPPDEPLRKAALMELIERLDARGCAPLVDNLRVLPAVAVDDAAAEGLTSLCITLLLAALELDALLLEQGRADFTQLVLAASRALADGDAPTELALALDYRIRHLLVDEFQDTSESQLRFFRLLVQGWAPGDGNTFFAVGDPMQSIYRFRNADVRVFYEAWHHGIGPVPLEPVRLSANFRAGPRLVDWYNRTFTTVMGRTDDPLLGRVAYSPAAAARSGTVPAAEVAVHCELLATGSEQSAAVAERIRRLQDADPAARIAVLVRSRSHLGGLLPALRRAGIAWRATDIEPLATRPVVQDLVSLARALADPADRLAWFAVLRAPWVGLDHPDLEVFADCADLARAIIDPSRLARLSADGRQRLERLCSALDRGRRLRHEAPPRTALETVWICCGGVDAYPGREHLRDAERLLTLVDELGPQGDEPEVLAGAAERLFAEAGGTAAVEIMTIHKAKGLEFDHVLLPFLERTTRTTDPPMLLWRREGDGLLLAGRESGALYAWLAREERARERHERERLLYVACTRARETLHLFAEAAERPAGDSLLALLWPALDGTAQPAPPAAAVRAEARQVAEAAPSYLPLPERAAPRLRLPADYLWQPPPLEFPALPPPPAVTDPDEALGHLPDVAFGTLLHETLRHLGTMPLPEDIDGYARSRRKLWREALQAAGVAADAHDGLLARLEQHLRGVLNDPAGRRILMARRGAHSELGVTETGESGLVRRFVDRTFVDDDGCRWIIDYKTGSPPPGTDVDRFVEAQQRRYAPQLHDYAASLRAFFPEPVRLALYFTALPRLVTVEPVRGNGS